MPFQIAPFLRPRPLALAAPFLHSGDMAVITLWEGALVGVRLADGGVAWRVPLPGLAIGPPAGHAGLIVATWEEAHGAAAGAVAVDPITGGVRWRAALPPGGVSGPALGAVLMRRAGVPGDLAATRSAALFMLTSAVSLAAWALRWARFRTSSATTAKPRPASPARAASTAAFNARMFV